ncbi:hypothetical protein [Ornithinimicrobium cavernae]|uniref:hypothetical protein n=1 Tax=Ornithinimicrobium cavernae TaxID=2666047 RepID=UPI000D698A30|nr:hypothetical protein [Ornithinimicrobium cavernae]
MRKAWTIAAAVLGALLLAATAIVAFTDAWGIAARLAQRHPAGGWAIAAVAVVAVPAAWALGRHGQVGEGAALRRARVARADVGHVAHQQSGAGRRQPPVLGVLGRDGRARRFLRDMPVDKKFSSEAARDMDGVAERWAEAAEPIFDRKLRAAMSSAKVAFEAYWGTLGIRLNAPGHLKGQYLDLQVEAPEGAAEEGDARYYAFLSDVRSRRRELLESLAPVDARLHELRVEADALKN